jgi:hypothetical protein
MVPRPQRKPRSLDPCPCTSGKRFKDCHGRLDLLGYHIANYYPGMAPVEVFIKAAREATEGRLRRERLGEIQLPNTMEFAGQRMVGVGGNLYGVDPKLAPLNFMGRLLVQTLGEAWCAETFRRTALPLHPIAVWYPVLMEWQDRQVDAQGMLKVKLSGPVMAWFMLAYDVWVLSHHQLLMPLMARLRDPHQFQGARLELTTYALFVRAGFTLHPENEKDTLKDHFEFTATHEASVEQVAVESKSRHRPGVLSFGAGAKARQNPSPGIRRTLRNALKKSHDMPYVVCIDLNLAPSDAATGDKNLESATKEIEGLMRSYHTRGVKFPATRVILTNYPHHYGSSDVLDAIDNCVIQVAEPAHPFVSIDSYKRIVKALDAYGNLPRSWEDFDR